MKLMRRKEIELNIIQHPNRSKAVANLGDTETFYKNTIR